MRWRDDSTSDQGFTLVELMTAMAVFGILMAIVGAAMLSGFSTVREVMSRSDTQDKAQLAAEWLSRELRYIDLPEGQTSAITTAGTNSIVFFTYSGTGAKHDVPYKVEVYVTAANASKPNMLQAKIYTPTVRVGGGGWDWDPAVTKIPVVTRDLFSVPVSAGSPLAISVWMSNPTVTPTPTPRKAVLTATAAAITRQTGEIPGYVVIQLGNPKETRNLVSQQVKLVNCDVANSC